MTDALSARAAVGIRRLAGNIGAEVGGVDAAADLSDETAGQVRAALLRHKVIFLRGQELDYAGQVAFAQRLGSLALGHPTLASPPGQPFLEEIDGERVTVAGPVPVGARTLGATSPYTLLHVQIRAALPFILTGMRFAMAGAWSSIVAVELLAATSGLGFMIMQAGDYLDTSLVFAGIITIALAGLILDTVLPSLLLLADPGRRR